MSTIFLLVCISLVILSVHAAPERQKAPPNPCDNYHIAESLTPGFTNLKDYPNRNINHRWKLPNGLISLQQTVSSTLIISLPQTNAATISLRRELHTKVDLQWTKCKTSAEIDVHSDGSVHQEWEFGDHVTITLDIGADDAIDQDWRLHDLYFKYSRSASHKVTVSGTATLQDLAPYKNLIDQWCAENTRFVPTGYCVIYDRL